MFSKKGLTKTVTSVIIIVKLRDKRKAYHPEPKLNAGNRTENFLHVHEYKRDDFLNRTTRNITSEEIEMYKKYFKGVTFK